MYALTEPTYAPLLEAADDTLRDALWEALAARQPIALRDYQVEARDKVRAEWDKGIQSTLLCMSTGTGKTETFAGVLQAEHEAGNLSRALILAHRQELIFQPVLRIVKGWPGLPCPGIVMANYDMRDAAFVVATVQTLTASKGRRLDDLLACGSFSHLVIDECFPAGTLVDGRPIESICVGDEITAWDEGTRRLVTSRVTHKFVKQAPRYLLRIRAGGRSVICTPNHPFLVNREGVETWVEARDLVKSDVVAIHLEEDKHGEEQDLPGLRKEDSRHVRHSVSAVRGRETTPGYSDHMRGLQDVNCDRGPLVARAVSPYRTGLLLRGMQDNLCRTGATAIRQVVGRVQPNSCVRAHEARQPHEAPRSASKSESDFARYGSPANRAIRERTRPDGSTTAAGRRFAMANGSCSPHWQTTRQRLSALLQARHCERGAEARHRSRRQITLCASAPGTGQEAGRAARWVRVDNLEVHQQGSDGAFGGLCPGGLVYNLEVERFHTYTANGFVVHNCHRSTARTYGRVIERLRAANPALRVLGVTATPKRTDGDGLKRVFQSVAHRISIKDAIAMGALVPFMALAVKLPVSLADVPETGEGWDDEILGEVMSAANALEIIVETWRKHGENRPTVAFTASVKQAHRLAEAFRDAGIPAAAIDGTTPKGERWDILQQYQRGALQVVANCNVLTEGWDAPHTACVLNVKPTKSDLVYVQAVGRGLRTAPGKKDALLLDFCPLDARNMVMAGDLLGKPRQQRKLEQKASALGLILDVFGIDAEGNGIDGDPNEVVLQVLDFLGQGSMRKLAWLFDGTVATVATGKGEMLALVAPQQERIAVAESLRAGGRWRAAWDTEWERIQQWHLYHVRDNRHLSLLASSPTQDAAYDQAEQWTHEHAEAWAVKRDRRWRGRVPTLKRRAFAQNLGVWRDDMTDGECSQAISHELARRVLRRNGIVR